MYQQLFGNNNNAAAAANHSGDGSTGADGDDSGAAAAAAFELIAEAGSAYVREETGCVSFDAFILGVVPKTNIVRLAPFNVASALLLPGAGEYWSAATADHSAIRLHHKQLRAPQIGKQKRAVTFVPLSPAEEREGVVADLHEIAISMYVKEGSVRSSIIPPVFSFVRVVNYRLTAGDKSGDTRLFPNASALDRARYNELNAQLTTTQKLALLFPIDGGQALPAVAPLMAYADYLKTQHVQATDNAARRKEEKALLRAVAPPLPVVLLRSDREWRAKEFIRTPVHQALVLPPTGLPPAAAGEPARFFASLLVNPGDGFCKEIENKEGKQVKLMGRFDFDAYQRTRAGADVEHFRVRNATLFADKFAGLGVTHYAWVDKLLQQTPVPVHILATTDLRETIENTQNRDPAALSPYSPAGAISADVIAAEWRLRETLERRAIPVPRALVVKRYGAEFAKLRLLDDKKPPTDRTPEAWKAAKLENIYGNEADFQATGVLACDVENINQLPSEDEADFYMLPLIKLSTPLPMAVRVDPSCPLPPDEHPLAVTLTPSEGEAFVRAALGKEPKGPLDWMEPDMITPKFLCFATAKRAPAAAVAVADAAALTLPKVDRALLPEAAANVPADMNALRGQLIAQTLGLGLALGQGAKRARAESPEPPVVARDLETGEPPAKRARVDAAAAAPLPSSISISSSSGSGSGDDKKKADADADYEDDEAMFDD